MPFDTASLGGVAQVATILRIPCLLVGNQRMGQIGHRGCICKHEGSGDAPFTMRDVGKWKYVSWRSRRI